MIFLMRWTGGRSGDVKSPASVVTEDEKSEEEG